MTGMTPDERDRLTRLETVVADMSVKLDAALVLLQKHDKQAIMGAAFLVFVTKLGAALAALATIVAWIGDRLHWWPK